MWGIAVEILAGVEDEITQSSAVKKKRTQKLNSYQYL